MDDAQLGLTIIGILANFLALITLIINGKSFQVGRPLCLASSWKLVNIIGRPYESGICWGSSDEVGASDLPKQIHSEQGFPFASHD